MNSKLSLRLCCLLVVALGVLSCKKYDLVGLFYGASPRADSRFEDSQQYNQSHAIDTLFATTEAYHLYVCGDSHITRSRANWETFITTYRQDFLCPLAIHLGDIISEQDHWEYACEPLTAIPHLSGKQDTLMTVTGNHDLYFDQWKDYKRYFYTSTYYFLVQTPSGALDLFIMLDSGEGTLGEKQLAWLKQLLSWAKSQPFRHRFVCTHTNLFMEDWSQSNTSNFPLEETYYLMNLWDESGVDYVLTGHDHYHSVTQWNHCHYLVLDALEDAATNASFLLMNVSTQVTYDFVSLAGK